MHRSLLHNGTVRDTQEFLVAPGQVGYLNGWGVFSTVRVAQGVLFAFERHYRRMRFDAERFRIPFRWTEAELQRQLLLLVDANRVENGTLRVCVVRNHGGLFESPGIAADSDLVAFTTDLNDWGSGVRLTYVPHGRHGASPFSGAKVLSWAQNLTWYETAHERGFDEVILLNENGQVSECTSANIFIVEEHRVLTPPLATSGCLPGVTRALLLDTIRVPGLTISEEEITPSQLEAARQVFITSTTRDLLPVLSVDGCELKQDGDALAELTAAFQRYRGAYVKVHGAVPV